MTENRELARAAAFESVDGAEFVAGGAVLFLLRDGGEVGEMVGGCHGDGACPEAGEGGMAVEQGVVLGVGVQEVKWVGVAGEGALDVFEEAAKDGEFKRVKEEGERGRGGERVGGGVGVVKGEGSEGVGERVVAPEVDVGLRDGGEERVELDAFDAEKGKLRGEQHGTAFASADVEEDGLLDGLRCGALEP